MNRIKAISFEQTVPVNVFTSQMSASPAELFASSLYQTFNFLRGFYDMEVYFGVEIDIKPIPSSLVMVL